MTFWTAFAIIVALEAISLTRCLYVSRDSNPDFDKREGASIAVVFLSIIYLCVDVMILLIYATNQIIKGARHG